MKNIVLLGGGSGISNLLPAFTKEADWNVSAIIAMSDSGGSTGVIRESYQVPPLGDLVKNLSTLSMPPGCVTDIKMVFYRDTQQEISGYLDSYKHMVSQKGLKIAHNMLDQTRHHVIPVTMTAHHLELTTQDGTRIMQEGKIIQTQTISHNVGYMSLSPQVHGSKEACDALKQADMIIIGPGTLYTSLIACLLPEGIAQTICDSSAIKVFICNAANFPAGHCDRYSVDTYIEELLRLTRINSFDAILAHDGSMVPASEQVVTKCTLGTVYYDNFLSSPSSDRGGKFDSIERNTLRHDGKKVVEWIKKIFSYNGGHVG